MSTALDPADAQALWVSLQLALATSLTLVVLCTPLALWLARSRSRLVPWVHAVSALPLVLPPTVVGFYLLMLLGAEGPVGRAFLALGFEVPAFSFLGLWLASLLVSLPFVVQPLHTAFTSIGARPWEVAATLRAAPLDTFLRVVLPLAKPGYLAALVLSFAHTLGEFGVVLMVGGNIRGRTQTVSTAIYGHVEAMQYPSAHLLSALLVLLGLATVGVLRWSSTRRSVAWS